MSKLKKLFANMRVKIPLAELLAVLVAILFGYMCFLSINFLTLGDAQQSIIWSVIIAVLLGGTALGAILLKRTNRHFKICRVWEKILLGFFTVFACIVVRSPFPHFFVVSSQKTEIQNKLVASITQAENMFAGYERYAENRELLYRSKLQSVVDSKNITLKEYIEYGFEYNGVSDKKQIENKMFTIHSDLFPSNYTAMKQVDAAWLADARNIVEDWKPIGIVGVVSEVEQNSKKWLNALVELSTVRERGEQAENFTYNLSFDDVKKHFTTLGNPTPLSVLGAVVAYALMLLSWFLTKRSTKSTGSLEVTIYETIIQPKKTK
ncbi:MAG: hypothetical protein LBB62_00700 [Proteiniphilum sp.]|jgi:hypothetical protein|nr:hypothetical protein [Proteiniphilum sp.]